MFYVHKEPKGVQLWLEGTVEEASEVGLERIPAGEAAHGEVQAVAAAVRPKGR